MFDTRREVLNLFQYMFYNKVPAVIFLEAKKAFDHVE